MNKQITITSRQQLYLKALKGGPKTTNALVREIMVTGNSISKMMKELRRLGLVESRTAKEPGRGRRYEHELVESYDNLMARITVSPRTQQRVTDEDIECAVSLRKEDFTGKQMYAEFRKRRECNRTDYAIKNIVDKARRHEEWE